MNNKINKQECNKGCEGLDKLLECGYPIKRGSIESWNKYTEEYKKETGKDYIVPSGVLVAVKVFKDNTNTNYRYRLKLGNGIDTFYSLPYLDSISDESLCIIREINEFNWIEESEHKYRVTINTDIDDKFISLIYDSSVYKMYFRNTEDESFEVAPNNRIDVRAYLLYDLVCEVNPDVTLQSTDDISLQLNVYDYVSNVVKNIHIDDASYETKGISYIASDTDIATTESAIDEGAAEELEESPKLINPFHLIRYIRNWWNGIKANESITLSQKAYLNKGLNVSGDKTIITGGLDVTTSKTTITGGFEVGGGSETILGGAGNLTVAGQGTVTFAKGGGTTFSTATTYAAPITVNNTATFNGSDVTFNAPVTINRPTYMQDLRVTNGSKTVIVGGGGLAGGSTSSVLISSNNWPLTSNSKSNRCVFIGDGNSVNTYSNVPDGNRNIYDSIIIGNSNRTESYASDYSTLIYGDSNYAYGSRNVIIGNSNTFYAQNNRETFTYIYGVNNKDIKAIYSEIHGFNNRMTSTTYHPDFNYTYGVLNSYIFGSNNIVGTDNQTVVGQWNDNKTDTVLEVANGTEQQRANMLEVSKTGDVRFKNNLVKMNNPIYSTISNIGATPNDSSISIRYGSSYPGYNGSSYNYSDKIYLKGNIITCKFLVKASSSGYMGTQIVGFNSSDTPVAVLDFKVSGTSNYIYYIPNYMQEVGTTVTYEINPQHLTSDISYVRLTNAVSKASTTDYYGKIDLTYISSNNPLSLDIATIGDVSNLQTTNKDTLLYAINELLSMIQNINNNN